MSASQCDPTFLNKHCACMSDPLDPYSTICAYIDRQTGVVFPCDLGCCRPACDGVGHQPPNDVRLKSYANLPENYGTQLQTSNDPTPVKGATDLASPTTSYDSGPPPDDYKVWQIWLLIMMTITVAAFALCMA
jgi:hypothetical protein